MASRRRDISSPLVTAASVARLFATASSSERCVRPPPPASTSLVTLALEADERRACDTPRRVRAKTVDDAATVVVVVVVLVLVVVDINARILPRPPRLLARAGVPTTSPTRRRRDDDETTTTVGESSEIGQSDEGRGTRSNRMVCVRRGARAVGRGIGVRSRGGSSTTTS